jgi:putative SbcD/Mre11-related phosphoesterase
MLSPEWLLTPERAAVHMPSRTAVVADLHLGYAQARQSRGEAVPKDDGNKALSALRALAVREKVERLVIAGDLLEDGRCGEALEQLTDWLAEVSMELAGVVPGNHDRGFASGRKHLPVFPDGMQLGDWHVVHGDGALPSGQVIQGHVHPCLRWEREIVAPCFLVDLCHVVLPAFSGDAAGVNVLNDPRWHRYRCHVIAGDQVLDLGEVGTLKRRQ